MTISPLFAYMHYYTMPCMLQDESVGYIQPLLLVAAVVDILASICSGYGVRYYLTSIHHNTAIVIGMIGFTVRYALLSLPCTIHHALHYAMPCRFPSPSV